MLTQISSIEINPLSTLSSILRAAIDIRLAGKWGNRFDINEIYETIRQCIPELHAVCRELRLIGSLQRVTGVTLENGIRISLDESHLDPRYFLDRAHLNGRGENLALNLPAIAAVVEQIGEPHGKELQELLTELGIRQEQRVFAPERVHREITRPLIHLERG